MSSHFSQYLDAWRAHGDGRAETTDAMIAAASGDVTYDDINAEKPWVGADGLREMCAVAHQTFTDLTFDVRAQVTDEHRWSITWEAQALHAVARKPISFRGASFGTFDADGRVAGHTDYWSPMLLAAQLES